MITSIINHSDCPEFGDVSNGKVIIALNITIHLTVQIKCNTGYSIKGASLNHCINGKWKAPKATCKGTNSIYYYMHACTYIL